MKSVQVTINPTEIRSVKYLNNFNVKSGEKISLKIQNEVGIKLNPASPLTAAVLIKCMVTDEESKCIEMEIETITTVVTSTFVDDLELYIKQNYMPAIMLASNEKVRTLSALMGTPIRLPNPGFGLNLN